MANVSISCISYLIPDLKQFEFQTLERGIFLTFYKVSKLSVYYKKYPISVSKIIKKNVSCGSKAVYFSGRGHIL